jgi:galactose mutarotase-like enzyme
MVARLDAHWQYNGLRAVVLDNRHLQVTLFPETGARIYNLIHKPSDTNLLWHHPRTLPRVIPYGSTFDDTWPGGWDEVLPSTEVAEYRGERLPNMGELWALPWEWKPVKTDDGSACVYTGVSTPILPLRFERWLRLDANEPVLHLRYRLTNLGLTPLDLIWGIHPVFAITPNHRIDLPACTGLVGQSSGTRLGEPGQQYQWPTLPTPEGAVDMSYVPPFETNVFGGHYATELTGNWYALTDTAKRVGVGMVFPTDIFRALWIWQVYGGWRGLYQLAIEPWVGYPVRLEQAIDAGRQRVLLPGQPLEYEVSMVVYTGLTRVSAIQVDGSNVTVL